MRILCVRARARAYGSSSRRSQPSKPREIYLTARQKRASSNARPKKSTQMKRKTKKKRTRDAKRERRKKWVKGDVLRGHAGAREKERIDKREREREREGVFLFIQISIILPVSRRPV